MSGKTQYFTSSTLDGFLADSNHSLEWLFQFDPKEFAGFDEFIADVGALAMGSHTYEWMLEHLIGPEADHPQPWPYLQPTWVFSSRQLPAVDGVEIKFVRGSVASEHGAMRKAAEAKNVWIVGGGEFAGQFYDAGLLDEIIVGIASVTLGEGYPLFPRRVTNPPLKLLSASSQGPGFATLRYEVPKG